MSASPKLIFIVGVGRSGTSLLQSMVGAHPAIAVSPETHFLRHYLLDQKGYGRVSTLGGPELLAKLSVDEEFLRAGVDPTDILPQGEPVNLSAAYLRLASELARRAGAEAYCDKDPNLVDYLPALHAHFPKAYVIHLYRDPRDVVLSKTKAKWSRGRPYWLHALIGEAQLQRGLKHGPALFADRWISLRYEALLENPGDVLSDLCRRLDLPYATQMLTFQETARDLVTERELSWKKETFKPLMRQNRAKWRTKLSTRQVALIEQLSPTFFRELGYERNAAENALIGAALLPARPAFRQLYGWLRRNHTP